MKTHKVISKTIHRHILSLRGEYFLGQSASPQSNLPPGGTIFSLGQPISPKDFPTFSTL